MADATPVHTPKKETAKKPASKAKTVKVVAMPPSPEPGTSYELPDGTILSQH